MTKLGRTFAALSAALAFTLGAAGCVEEDPFDIAPPEECDVESQKTWAFETMQEVYLFNDQLDPDAVDPAEYEDVESYVRAIRISPDRWTRAVEKSTSDALFMEGKFVGLGFKSKRDADDRLRVAFVYPGSPADLGGMVRGDEIRAINGSTIIELDENGWGDIWGENDPGVETNLVMAAPTRDPGVETDAEGNYDVHLVKDWIDISTVPIHDVYEVDGQKVGYLVFLTFVEPSYDALDLAFAEFEEQGVQQVIIDMRYNGGGLVAVARHLINLIVGANAAGETSYFIEYNDNLSDENSSRDVSEADYSLDLDRVVFITTGTTYSASELVINAVRPHIDTVIVGDTTGGKPVGSKSFEFCEKKLYPITFRLLNAESVGDYYDGLEADCREVDDLEVVLGETEEDSLASALQMAVGAGCPGNVPDEGEAFGVTQLRGPDALQDAGVFPTFESLFGGI